MVQGRKSWLCLWKVYVFFDVGRDHEHSIFIARALASVFDVKLMSTRYMVGGKEPRRKGRIFRAIHHTMINIKYVLTAIG